MKKGQRRARRMALYLSSIGIPPVPSAGSYKQWAAVVVPNERLVHPLSTPVISYETGGQA
jgi:hypothetical protein